jgi:hypothetical protein
MYILSVHEEVTTDARSQVLGTQQQSDVLQVPWQKDASTVDAFEPEKKAQA